MDLTLGLIAAENGLIGSKSIQLFLVASGNIHGEIEGRPGRLHATMSEEEPLNLVRRSAFQRFSVRNFIPFRQAGIEDAVHDDASRPFCAKVPPITASTSSGWAPEGDHVIEPRIFRLI